MSFSNYDQHTCKKYMYNTACFLVHEKCTFIHVIGLQQKPLMIFFLQSMCLKVISPKVMPPKTRVKLPKIFCLVVQTAELCHLKFYYAQQK